MSEHLNELLSAYVDDDVTAIERMKVDAHHAQCEQCSADLEGVRRVVRRAGSLDDLPPSKDLWAGIAERIGDGSTRDVVPLEPRRRRIAFTVPQLAAAAVVLVTLSSGAATLLERRGQAPSDAQATAPDSIINQRAKFGSPEVQITSGYDAAIRDLQQMLSAKRGRLDTGTVRVVEQSLAVIDAAIRQARTALANDPNNPYLSNHLQRALDRKLDVLRHAAKLPVVS